MISTWHDRLRGCAAGLLQRRALALRGLALTSAYAATSAVVLVSAVGLGRVSEPSILAGVLSAFFIITLASGLEPGTTKALLVNGISPNVTRPEFCAIAMVSALKAALASAPLGLLWSLSDRSISAPVLIWLPVMVVSGFLATDFRVLLDGQGRHVAAIWLKQSSLLLGFATLAGLVALGSSLAFAFAVAGLVRLGWTGLALLWLLRGTMPSGLSGAAPLKLSLDWLLDRHWLHFAVVSSLAAVSGSLDRITALRLLPPVEYNAYFVLYEIVTKLWLLPYMAAPILFARRASGSVDERLLFGLHALIGLAGLAFVGGLLAVAAGAPHVFQLVIGLSRPPLAPLAMFGLAVVASSLTQLFLVDLQARGRAKWATVLTVSSLVASAVLFYVLTSWWGLSGLLIAWLVKSLIELGVSLEGLRRTVVR